MPASPLSHVKPGGTAVPNVAFEVKKMPMSSIVRESLPDGESAGKGHALPSDVMPGTELLLREPRSETPPANQSAHFPDSANSSPDGRRASEGRGLTEDLNKFLARHIKGWGLPRGQELPTSRDQEAILWLASTLNDISAAIVGLAQTGPAPTRPPHRQARAALPHSSPSAAPGAPPRAERRVEARADDPAMLPVIVLASDAIGLQEALDEAVALVRGIAIKEGSHGILVTRHSYTKFTVTISKEVPFGLSVERDADDALSPVTERTALDRGN
jgi:hypothetical protein